MWHGCSDYIYAKFQVNRFKNGFHIVHKLWKCQYVKFSDSFFDKNMPYRNENSTIEFPVKFRIETVLFVAKITALKFSPFSPRSLRFMSWTLSWPWPHIWPIFKKDKHSSKPSDYKLLIAAGAFCVFLQPFIF